MSEKTFSIGELCAEFDVTPRTLRFYEQRELLSPIRDGQKRIFTARDRSDETVDTRSTAWANSDASTSKRRVFPWGITRV